MLPAKCQATLYAERTFQTKLMSERRPTLPGPGASCTPQGPATSPGGTLRPRAVSSWPLPQTHGLMESTQMLYIRPKQRPQQRACNGIRRDCSEQRPPSRARN
eukprot:11593579-Alexandrium_andersonii.AAC.1